MWCKFPVLKGHPQVFNRKLDLFQHSNSFLEVESWSEKGKAIHNNINSVTATNSLDYFNKDSTHYIQKAGVHTQV